MDHLHGLSMAILDDIMKKVPFWLLAMAMLWPCVGQAEQAAVPDVGAILHEASVVAQGPGGVFLPGLMDEIAVAQAKAGHHEAAKALFERIIQLIRALYFDPNNGFHPGRGVSELLDIALKHGQGGLMDERAQLLTEIIHYTQNITDPETRFFAFRELAIAQVKMGDTQGSSQTFTRLFTLAEQLQGQRRLDSDYLKIESVLHLAKAYIDIAELEAARATTTRAMQMLEALPAGRFEEFGYMKLWKKIAMLRGRVGDAVEAKSTWARLLTLIPEYEPGFKIHVTLRLAETLRESGHGAMAADLVEQGLTMLHAWENGEPPIPPPSTYHPAFSEWDTLALAKAKLGDIEGALAVEAAFSHGKGSIGKRQYQKVAYVAAENFDEAFAIVKQEEPIDYYDLLAIVEGQAKQGRVAAAMEAFQLLKAQVTKDLQAVNKSRPDFKITRPPPDYAQVLRAVAVARGRWDNVAHAVAWARRQETPYEQARALLGVAEGLLEKRAVAP